MFLLVEQLLLRSFKQIFFSQKAKLLLRHQVAAPTGHHTKGPTLRRSAFKRAQVPSELCTSRRVASGYLRASVTLRRATMHLRDHKKKVASVLQEIFSHTPRNAAASPTERSSDVCAVRLQGCSGSLSGQKIFQASTQHSLARLPGPALSP